MPDVTLTPLTIHAAWNVQGRGVADIVQRLFGVALPEVPNTATSAGDRAALWLGPESWLLASGSAPLGDFEGCRDALQAARGALFDVSASRVAFAVSGAQSSIVLAAGCPLDLHVFAPGHCAQSVFGRVNALYFRDDATFVVMVARSFGRGVWHGLLTAASEFDHEVTAPRAL